MKGHQLQTIHNFRTRMAPGFPGLSLLLAPAAIGVGVLFGGGLILGILQSFGFMHVVEVNHLSIQHYLNVLMDPDFLESLWLTLYIAMASTLIAASLSVAMALLLVTSAHKNRLIQFIFQIPLTVPHLVIAVAIVFMLSPTGLLSRFAMALGLIDASSHFPLLINDRWGIGIILTYVWKEIPFITVMILSVLSNSGIELLHVGQTLKANRWQRFRYITLPIIFPSLGAASLIVFAYTFGAFEVPYLLGQTYPMMLSVWAYRNYSDIDLLARPEGITTGILIAVIVCLTVLIAQIITKTARRKGIVL